MSKTPKLGSTLRIRPKTLALLRGLFDWPCLQRDSIDRDEFMSAARKHFNLPPQAVLDAEMAALIAEFSSAPPAAWRRKAKRKR